MIERLRFDEQPERLPPHNFEAEEAVLGSALLEGEVVGRVSGMLDPRDFYRERNERIYAAMRALHDRDHPVDYVTLIDELDRTQQLALAGGTTYLAGLLGAVPTPIHAEHYAKMVADAAAMRRLISAGGKISTLGFQNEHDPATAIEKAEQILFDAAASRATSTVRPLADLVRDYLDRLEATRSGQSASSAVPTGFVDLDRILTGGLKRSDLVILAARPSLGKTSLAVGVAAHVALRLKGGVAIFSLEMTGAQITERLLSSETGIEASRLVQGSITEAEERRLGHALGTLAEAAIVVDDDPFLTPSTLRARVRRIQKDTPLDLIVVDHISIMTGGGSQQNRVQEMDEITRQLKALAKEQHVPVLALCQLSRRVEDRNPKIPMLSDLRDSGAIEQNADAVVFIYREDRYDPETARRGIADLIVAKHRNGPTGQASLLFNERTTKFLDLEVQERGPWWTA